MAFQSTHRSRGAMVEAPAQCAQGQVTAGRTTNPAEKNALDLC